MMKNVLNSARRIWICFVAIGAIHACAKSALTTRWSFRYTTDQTEFLILLITSIMAIAGIIMEFRRQRIAFLLNVAVPCVLAFLVIFDAFVSQVPEAAVFSVVPFFFATVSAVLYATDKTATAK